MNILAVLPVLLVYIEFSHARRFLGNGFNDFREEFLNRAKSRNIPRFNNVKQFTFQQRLNHFDNRDNTTWTQRYWVNDRYFNKTGPVFLYVGGEYAESSESLIFLQVVKYTMRHNALLVSLEHRFFGQSRPFKNLSSKHLAYLNTHQALGDLASFRQLIYQTYNLTDDNKCISFGGSYAGNLAAWFRLKYPHLVHAAVASSPPILAKVDFKEYLEVVDYALNKYDENCTMLIRDATDILVEMIETKEGQKTIESLFNVCEPLKSEGDKMGFFQTITSDIMRLVQLNNSLIGSISIQQVCDIGLNNQKNSSDPVEHYAEMINFLEAKYNNKCLDASLSKFIKYLRNESYSESGDRQWVHLICNELGFFQTTSSTEQPFNQTVPLSFWIQLCNETFTDKDYQQKSIEQMVNATNTHYGGLNFHSTRVIFVNGEIDPWHPLSITNSSMLAEPSKNQVIFINGTSHCADMFPSEFGNDSFELTQAKKNISDTLGQWLRGKLKTL